MRHLLGSLGGVILTLVLLTLLALLVTPPVDDRPEIEEPLSISMVEAPQQQTPDNAPTPTQAAPAPPPAEAPPPPPPAPLPAPSPSSSVAMPTPDLPALEAPEVPLDNELPELATRQPQPTPQPDSQPEREPPPEPSPQAEAVTERSADVESTSDAASEQSAQDSAQAPASAAGPVSSPQPTSKVPPEYPARAQRRGLEGYVEVQFIIRPDGSVDSDSLRVIDAEPRNVFERAAMRAISRWQFPESASPRKARQRLVFRLEG